MGARLKKPAYGMNDAPRSMVEQDSNAEVEQYGMIPREQTDAAMSCMGTRNMLTTSITLEEVPRSMESPDPTVAGSSGH
jgi:hypothetical protein